jgi:hypothetical protein
VPAARARDNTSRAAGTFLLFSFSFLYLH